MRGIDNKVRLIAESPVGKTRVLLVEDHVILREGLCALLELESELEICGTVGDASEALATVPRLQPSLVITDIALPGRSGLELIAELRTLHPEIRVLVLTAHNTEEYIRAALNAGAHGYVLKDSGRADLLQAVRAVLAGGHYLCGGVATKVVSGFVNGADMKAADGSTRVVTDRERQVLTRVALGKSNKCIARDLGLSVKTVEKHRANLMRKLTLRNTAAVTMFALRHHYIEFDAQQDAD